MAFLDILPGILTGAAAIFGGGNDSGGDLQRITPTAAQYPGAPQFENFANYRQNAAQMFGVAPWRTIDYGHGLPSSGMQVPQFVPAQGQSVFNPNYGGGYSPGFQSNYPGGGFGVNSGAFPNVSPIYGQSYNPVAGFVNSVLSGGAAPQAGQNPAAGIFGTGVIPSGIPGQMGGGVVNYNQQTGGTQTPNPSTLGPGSPYPITEAAVDPRGGISDPSLVGAPSPEFQQQFTPNIFRDPFVSGINAANQLGSFAAQAAPGAGMFQAGLYDPNLNAFEQSFLTAGANLGLRGLESAFNQIDSQYENTPFAASRGRQRDDAANVFANQMMQQAGQMGMQRQGMATQNLPNAFQSPLNANQFAQTSAAGMYNLFDNAMRGDTKDQAFIFANYPTQSESFIRNA